MSSAEIGLPARIDPLVGSVLAGAGAVADLVEVWGSPLNLLFPQVFEQNLAAFQAVLQDRRLRYKINFAHKANQSRGLLGAAARAGIQADVASAGELAAAISVGFEPARIEATGPKGRRLLAALIEAGVTINVDNLWELAEIIRLAGDRAAASQSRVPVLLRLGGFDPPTSDGSRRMSRFGIPYSRSRQALDLLRDSTQLLEFRGVAFHLDSSDVREKVRAVSACLEVFEAAWSVGLTPEVLNIGGGFRQVFTADAEAFERYVQALRRGLSGEGPALTWNGNTLGYRHQDGAVRGTPVFHKYANTSGPIEGLIELLDSPLPGQGGRTITQVLRDNLIELWIEPGKALVDQAGVTLAQVEFSTEAADGSLLVCLDLSRDKICPADQEVMLDPLLLPARQPASSAAGSGAVGSGAVGSGAAGSGAAESGAVGSGAVGVYFVGNLCLERDLIFNHLTFLDRLPEPGDLVAFVNTAGYQMDLSASAALLQPRPRKVVVTVVDGSISAAADDSREVDSCCTTTSPN